MFEDELPVEVGDDTPPIKVQAEKRGWKCDFFSFGKSEVPGIEHFNPGLVRRPDGLWLLVRRSEIREGYWYGHNSIWACKLREDKVPIGGPKLWFPESGAEEQFEDPRAVYWHEQTWIGCCNFTWFLNGSWTGAHQMIAIFKDQSPDGITEASWTAIARRDPAIGTNSAKKGNTRGKHNKNLLWWFHEDKLHCLYLSDPWQVVEFGASWDQQVNHVGDGVKWKYGTVRGGTPPVLVDGIYYTFFHSSVPWRGRYRRYYMGAIAFSATPPFTPIMWTQQPLLIGSQNDYWHQKKPLVVFPCGAVMENGTWLISLGVNDLKCAWLEIPHADILKLLQAAPILPGLSLLSERTEKYEPEPIPFTEEDARGNNLPVPVLAEATAEIVPTPRSVEIPERVREVQESTIGIRHPDSNSCSGQNPPLTSLQQRAAKARAALAAKLKADPDFYRNRSKKKKRKKRTRHRGKKTVAPQPVEE